MWDHDEAGVFVETLFAKHHGEIYAYLLRMLRDPELAADLTQDAFVKAYKNYDTLEKPENARAWLYQIAHRVALDEIRRRKIVRFFPWTGESHGSAPVGRAPRDGRAPVGRPAARPGAHPRAPARRPPARRAPRPDRPRARRRARRQPRRGPRAPDPRPREPPPGARRRARRPRPRPRPRRRPRTRPRVVADEPRAPPPPARRPVGRDARARPRASPRRASTAPLDPVEAAWLDAHLGGLRGLPLGRRRVRGRPPRASRPARRQPVPPRDLWARTSAAIEREAGVTRQPLATGCLVPPSSDPARRPVGRRGHRRRRSARALLSGGFINGPSTAARPAARRPIAAVPTLRPSRRHADGRRRRLGRLARAPSSTAGWPTASTKIDKVCPTDRPARLRTGQRPRLEAGRPRPSRRSRSRSRRSRTRPSSSGPMPTGNEAVVVMSLPTPRPTATPSPTATPRPTATPSPTPEPTDTPAASESATAAAEL